MRRPALALAAVLLLAGPADAACLDPDGKVEAAEGTLQRLRTSHPNGSLITGYILLLDRPICLDDAEAGDDVKSVVRVHVVPADPAVSRRLAGWIGRRVRAFGEPIAAHTAWHLAPIVLLNADAALR